MRISGDSDSSVSDLQPVTGILENSQNLGPGMGANKKGVEPRPLQTTPTKGRTEQHKADAPSHGGVALSAASVQSRARRLRLVVFVWKQADASRVNQIVKVNRLAAATESGVTLLLSSRFG